MTTLIFSTRGAPRTLKFYSFKRAPGNLFSWLAASARKPFQGRRHERPLVLEPLQGEPPGPKNKSGR